MSLRARLAALAPPRATSDCRACRHFCADARHLEATLPGTQSLSSAYASARGADGLCLRHQRVTNGRARCSAFADAASL
jgi:hypothetical protein